MKRTHRQIKAALLAGAEVVVDELLDWHETSQSPTLIQVEEVIPTLGKRLAERMAEVVLGDPEAIQPLMAPPCPRCEQEMRTTGRRQPDC